MTSTEFVKYTRYVWNIIITEKQAEEFLKMPNILSNFNLQKAKLGGNEFSTNGINRYEGHKFPKLLT